MIWFHFLKVQAQNYNPKTFWGVLDIGSVKELVRRLLFKSSNWILSCVQIGLSKTFCRVLGIGSKLSFGFCQVQIWISLHYKPTKPICKDFPGWKLKTKVLFWFITWINNFMIHSPLKEGLFVVPITTAQSQMKIFWGLT